MTRRLFVCHASAEIESTSEVVDALENSLDFPEGALLTSGLPGYASDTHDEFALRDTLAGASMVLALVSESSLKDAAFCFQLGAAWALGLRTVLCSIGELDATRLPAVLRETPVLHAHVPEEWTDLIGDLSLRLGLVPRPAASVAPLLAPAPQSAPSSAVRTTSTLLPTAAGLGPTGFAVPAVELSPTVTQPGFRTPVSRPATLGTEVGQADETTAPGGSPDLPPRAAAPSGQEAELEAPAALGSDAQAEPSIAETVDQAFAQITDEKLEAPAPRHTYIDELRSIAELDAQDVDAEITTSPRHSYISELQNIAYDEPQAADQSALPASIEAPAPTFVTVSSSEPPLTSDIYARLPGCEMALEAGRSLSDCVFNRGEISDFRAELSGPLGRFYESLGGLWDELSSDQDIDRWADAVEGRLAALPEEARKIEDWYKLGYELAILHNLAGQLVLDGTDAAAEQQWRGALERFLMRAERAEIGYEDLGRVLGLLENLAGPSSERDLANIGRSLEELRRYAAGADGIHTAA